MFRPLTRIILTGAALQLVLLAGVAPQAGAIPAFARKYRTSCTTCHVAIPKRNAFGEAFRRNGYQIPAGDERYIKEEPVSLGAEAWKDMWPDAIWPGAIPEAVPFSAYVHQRFVLDNPTADKEFDAPHELELLIGNTLGRNIGFFGEWVMFEKGQNSPGLKRLFLQFSGEARCPPWGNTFSQEEIQALATFVESLVRLADTSEMSPPPRRGRAE